MSTESAPPTGGLIRVLAAVAHKEEGYLVCQRPAHKRHGGLWEFPGGKCEPGESDLEAMARELAEELGVEVSKVGTPSFEVRDPHSPFLIVFLPVTIVGTPECLEHSALTWAPLGSLLTLPLAPSDRRFVEHLDAHGHSQSDPTPQSTHIP